MAIAALLVLAGYFGFLERQLDWRTPAGQRVQGLEWQKWSTAAVEQARREGHPVMVDFTADSCLNCKWNKATAIDIDATRGASKHWESESSRAILPMEIRSLPKN